MVSPVLVMSGLPARQSFLSFGQREGTASPTTSFCSAVSFIVAFERSRHVHVVFSASAFARSGTQSGLRVIWMFLKSSVVK